MQLRIRIKSKLPVGKQTISDQSTRSFMVVIDQYILSFIGEILGVGREGGA